MNLVVILCASVSLTLFQPQLAKKENIVPKTDLISSISGEKAWKTEYLDANIRIESSTIVHVNKSTNTNQERIIFKYTNLTEKKLKLSFARNMYYNGVCYGCDKADKVYTLDIDPQQVMEFSEENKDKTFYIFSKDLNGTIKKTLDYYTLLNIETIVR